MFIDGQLVVNRSTVLTLDHVAALEALTEAPARMIATVLRYNWAQRQADQVTPPTLLLLQRMN